MTSSAKTVELANPDEEYMEWDPIDSNYAWYVVIPSTFCVAFSVMGVQYSAGIVNSAVLDAFKESEGTSAWVTAIAIGCLLLAMGPGGTIQANPAVGSRMLIMIGGVLAAIGVLVSVFATHIWHLYISYALVVSASSLLALCSRPCAALWLWQSSQSAVNNARAAAWRRSSCRWASSSTCAPPVLVPPA